ncbi:Alpha/Beta hydrolase protein [Coniochaeta sp. 2T2.1]|nr:Alpha/Beta hydrolase protein [Coniochaeta sp. 2T2.1]
MASHPSSTDSTFGHLSPWGKISLFLRLPLLLLYIPYLFTTSLASTPNLHWKQHLLVSFLRAVNTVFTTAQSRFVDRQQLTGPAIEAYCTSNKIPYRKVTLPLDFNDDSPGVRDAVNGPRVGIDDIPPPSLYFLQPKAVATENGPTILYAHGGAFSKPIVAGAQIPFVLRCAEACRAKQVVLLEYSLSPEWGYPAQHVQIVGAFRYLLEKEEGVKVGDVIVAGDSVGSQMVAGLLAHLVRPSPYAPAVKMGQEGERVRAAVFISPYAVLGTGDKSYERNKERDFFSREAAEELVQLWRPRKGEVWAGITDGKGGREVWGEVFPGGEGGKGRDKGVVKRAIVTVGTGEVMLDGIRRFAKEVVKAQTVVIDGDKTEVGLVGHMNRVLVESVGEAHVQANLDMMLGYEGGSSMRALLAFLESV